MADGTGMNRSERLKPVSQLESWEGTWLPRKRRPGTRPWIVLARKRGGDGMPIYLQRPGIITDRQQNT